MVYFGKKHLQAVFLQYKRHCLILEMRAMKCLEIFMWFIAPRF